MVGEWTPEDSKGFVETREVRLTVDEQRAEREIEIRPASNLDVRQRAGDVNHAPGLDVDAKRMEHAAEMEQVGEQGARSRTHEP
jgi:hypothetical protein